MICAENFAKRSTEYIRAIRPASVLHLLRELRARFLGFPLAGFSPLVGQYPWVTYDQLRAEYPQLLGINLGELVVILQDYETLEAAFVEQGDKFNGRPSAFVTDYFSTGRDGKVHSKLEGCSI